MKKAKSTNSMLFALFTLLLMPAATFAQTTIGVPQGFGGIFSCNQNGAYALSVGALGATGGVYVPVADATVELNTGTLVYKECVLREVVDAQRQAATAGFTQQQYTQVQTGRNGAPLYVVNQGQELLNNVYNPVVLAKLQDGTLSSLDPNIQAQVKQAVAQAYVASTQNAPSMLTCPYTGSTADFTSANPQAPIFNDILAVGSMCNPLFAEIESDDLIQSYAGMAAQYQEDQWNWGNGFYSVTTGGTNPLTQQIVTPSSLVNSSFTQVITSPFRQLESANDLGQMVGALFAGLSTQITSPNGGGLAGLSQPIGSSPSYLSQAVAQTTQNLQTQVSNVALANLSAALQVEQGYNSIMTSIANTLTGSITQLQTAESNCWVQIIQHVCTASSTPATGGGTCQDANGTTLHIATSTAFSQAVIAPQITPLANTTVNNLKTSQQALALITGLIQSVSSAGSADAQAVAIEQLNSLVANNQLHTQPQLQTAQAQQTAVQNSMSTLVTNTVSLWAGTDPNNSSNTNIPWDGSVSPGTGWCNFNNQNTLQLWEARWQ